MRFTLPSLAMGAAWALFLAAAPAAGADRSEVIRLEHAAAADVLATLIPEGSKLNEAGRVGLIPAGLSGLSISSAKALSVSGTGEAIRKLRELIRLVDIPRQIVRLRVWLIEGAKPEGLAQDVAVGQSDGGVFYVAVMDEPARQALLAGARRTHLQAELECGNNGTARLFRPGADPRDATFAAVTPRINGDGTVTLLVPLKGALVPPANEAGPTVLRRLPSGGTMLVAPREGGLALVVSVEVLPPQARP
jgi:hypothetical protein